MRLYHGSPARRHQRHRLSHKFQTKPKVSTPNHPRQRITTYITASPSTKSNTAPAILLTPKARHKQAISIGEPKKIQVHGACAQKKKSNILLLDKLKPDTSSERPQPQQHPTAIATIHKTGREELPSTMRHSSLPGVRFRGQPRPTCPVTHFLYNTKSFKKL